MEHRTTKGIQKFHAPRPSQGLSPVLHDPTVTDSERQFTNGVIFPASQKNIAPRYGSILINDGQASTQPHPSSNPTMIATTPHSLPPSGNMLSQEYLAGVGAYASNKPLPPSKFAEQIPSESYLSPGWVGNTADPAQRDSSFSSTTATSQGAGSTLSFFASTRASSATSVSNPGSTLFTNGVPEVEIGVEETKKEKKAKLKQLYKRASRSTKAFTRLFSRSPLGPNGASPSGGVSKRTSLKPPIPVPSVPNPAEVVDPFASGKSVVSYGLSPSEPDPPPLTPQHKRTESSPEAKIALSVDVQIKLKRSPSVSSPSGIPTPSPLTNLISKSDHQEYIRGRDSPFPVNSSNTSLPLPSRRSRSASQSSITSSGAQASLTKSSKEPTPPPVPPLLPPTPHTQARSPRPLPVPEMPPLKHLPELPPRLPPKLPPIPTVQGSGSASSTPAPPLQRPRSKSVREMGPPAVTIHSGIEPKPQRRLPRNPNDSANKEDISDGKVTLPDVSFESNRSHSRTETGNYLNGIKVGAPDLNGQRMGEAEAMPSEITLSMESKSTKEHVFTQRPRAATVRAFSERVWEGPEQATALSPSVVSGLAERVARSRAGSITSLAKDSGSIRPLPRPPVSNGRQPVLQLSTHNLPPPETIEVLPALEHRDPKNIRSQHTIPRSPSLPSLRSQFSDAPSSRKPKADSHHEESRGRTHIRSPSLPNFPTRFPGFLSQSDAKGQPVPLPASVTEGLRLRGRSSSRGHVRQISNDASSSSRNLSLPAFEEKKPTQELTPASTHGIPNNKSSKPSNSRTQSSPSPSASQPLKGRNTVRPGVENIRSPSMPDLRDSGKASSTTTTTRPRRTHLPPPALPRPQSRGKTSLPPSSDLPPLPDSHHNTVDAFQRTTSESGASLDTAPLPPKPGLHSKEYSYPPMQVETQPFHARSNRQLAKEGDWDFLDAPLRPPRSPFVQKSTAPVNARPSLRTRSRMTAGNPDAPSVPVISVLNNVSKKEVIGVAM